MFWSKAAAAGGGGGGGDSGGGGPTADARAGEGRQMNLQETRTKGTSGAGNGALDEATRQMRGRNMKKATGAQIARGKRMASKLKEQHKSDPTKQQKQRKAALTKQQQQRSHSVSDARKILRMHTNAVSLFECLQLFARVFRP